MPNYDLHKICLSIIASRIPGCPSKLARPSAVQARYQSTDIFSTYGWCGRLCLCLFLHPKRYNRGSTKIIRRFNEGGNNVESLPEYSSIAGNKPHRDIAKYLPP